MEYLFSYYGLDWLSSVIGLIGLHLVTEQRPVGFVLSAVAVLLAGSVAIMAGQYGFLLANLASFTISVRGFYKWRYAYAPVAAAELVPTTDLTPSADGLAR